MRNWRPGFSIPQPWSKKALKWYQPPRRWHVDGSQTAAWHSCPESTVRWGGGEDQPEWTNHLPSTWPLRASSRTRPEPSRTWARIRQPRPGPFPGPISWAWPRARSWASGHLGRNGGPQLRSIGSRRPASLGPRTLAPSPCRRIVVKCIWLLPLILYIFFLKLII